MRTEDFAEAIRQRLRETGQSQYRAAVSHDLPRDTIRRVLEGHSPGFDRAAEICEALGLEFYIGPPREPDTIRTAKQIDEVTTRSLSESVWATIQKPLVNLHDQMVALRKDLAAIGKSSSPHTDVEDDPSLEGSISEDRLQLDTLDPFPRKTQDPNRSTESADPSVWTNATEEERAKAYQRLMLLEMVDGRTGGRDSRAKAEASVAKEFGVSPAALETWRQRAHGLSGTVRWAALVDAPRSGRPSVIDPEMRETMEQLASDRGRQFTAKQARDILILRHGKAPSVPTIRRHLARLRKNRTDRRQDQGTSDTEGVHSLVDEPPATEADDADRLGRTLAAAEKIVTAAGIELGHQEKARLVLAIHRELQDAGADSSASDSAHSDHRDA